jgi:hypothetical protein
MSDWDGTETTDTVDTYDAGHVDAGEQNYDLEQGHAAYADEHDASQDYAAYGEANAYENDVNFEQGHHVEYDSPNGAHFEETDYTNYSSHEAASSAAYGEHYSATEHDASSSELDYLREHFDAQYLHADNYAGEQALTAK